jgi:hypothetical protein
MSLPAALAAPALQTVVAMSPLDSILHLFNSNPYFIGLTMLTLNLGGRFIGLEVSKQQEQFLQHPWVRRVLIFIVLFVGTRNIWVAFWATLVVILLLGYLFNENSAMCLFGQGGQTGSTCADPSQAKEQMSPEENDIFQRLSAKAQRLISSSVPKDNENDILDTDVYAANLALLRR